MVQFVCVFFHALLPLVFDCGYPKIVPLVSCFSYFTSSMFQVICFNAVTFFVLFANFYFFAYMKKKDNAKKSV